MSESLQELDSLLSSAATQLDQGASLIKESGLNASENIYRIGEALTKVYEIQNQIYELRPDLKPRFLDEE